MYTTLIPLLALAAGAPSDPPAATFKAPVRLTAGEADLGAKRLYPSPVLHDLDGDGHLDIVVGDLRGHLTVAPRIPGDGPPRFAKEAPVLGADGKRIDLGNW